jgi:hypothetical protein
MERGDCDGIDFDCYGFGFGRQWGGVLTNSFQLSLKHPTTII